MDRLNYFNPYQTKEGYHEDQLTRAYLTLLRHSHHAFTMFYEYCIVEHELNAEKGEEHIPLNELISGGWELATQKGNPLIETEWLLSILITDNRIKYEKKQIEKSNRNARYDGIITFGSKLTFLIEVKPNFNNVWYGQLRPSTQNLAEDTQIYSRPAILQWSKIIRQLSNLSIARTLSGAEKVIIEDFLSFVDSKFSLLNPYDRFDLCKGNHELIRRRINFILKSMVQDESLVQHHQGWGDYIQTPYNEIRKIGLILVPGKGKEWTIELSFYLGASQTQAKAFYRKKPNIDITLFDGWQIFGNFHVSFVTSNLVWFHRPNAKDYLNYWITHQHLIRQKPRKDVPIFLEKLVNDNVIQIDEQKRQLLEKKFYKTSMKTLNMVPEYGMLYTLKSTEAEQIDQELKIIALFKQKIKDVLTIIGYTGAEFLSK